MFKSLMFSLITGYLIYGIFFYFYQRKIIYPGAGNLPENIGINVPNLIKFFINTQAGQTECWYIEPSDIKKPHPLMIVAHGNAEYIDYLPNEFSDFSKMGFGVLMVEFPGYGRSEGSPSEKSITEVMIKAYDHIINKKEYNFSKIVIYGRSLGGGAACQLSKHRKSNALILHSTFTSIKSFASGFVLPAFLVLDPFDNLSVVSKYKEPILFLHGKYDEVIPYKHSELLVNAAKNRSFITYKCMHNNCPQDHKTFIQDIVKFLNDNKFFNKNTL